MADVCSEQMCFNLESPANPINMATRFNVNPSPLIICNSFGAHRSQSPGTLASRMELASLLARRELDRRGMAKNVTTRPNNSFKTGLEPKITGFDPTSIPRPSTRPHEQLKTKLPQTSTANIKPKVIKCIHDGNDIEQMSAEIMRLQNNLLNQLRKLRSLVLHKDDLTLEREQQKIKGYYSRLDWEDEETARERQARRDSEQVARSTRILYQLQNKVREIQMELSKTGNNKRKLIVMGQLGTGLRMAIRTTHHVIDTMLASGGAAHIPTITALTEQLSLLSLQVGLVCPTSSLENEGKVMQDCLSELKDYLNSRSFQLESRIPSGHKSTSCQMTKPSEKVSGPKFAYRTRAGRARRNVRRYKPNTARQPRQPSFAKQTFSSTLKQSPKKHQKSEHVSSPTPLSPPLPHDPPVVGGSQSHTPSSCASVIATSGDGMPEVSVTGLPPHQLKYLRTEMMRKIWLIEAKKQNDYLKEQIEKLERITQQQQQLNLMPVEVKKQADQQHDGPTDKSTDLTPLEVPRTSSDVTEPVDSLELPEAELMLQKLDHLECEEMQIKSKWDKIIYKDTPIKLTNQIKLSGRRPYTPPSDVLSDTGTTNDEYSDESRCESWNESKSEDRNESKNNSGDESTVKCYTQPPVPSWKHLERICNEIFDEILDETGTEVLEALDGLVDDLFDSEFHKPATCASHDTPLKFF